MRSVHLISKCLLVFLLLTAVNCSVTQKRYKVLRIFFDGVPDPAARESVEQKSGEEPGKETVTPRRKVRPQRVIKSSHPDFAGRTCDKCHNKSASNFLKAGKDKICFTCHDAGEFEGKYAHGPVAVKACGTCHLPHESEYENLLKQKDARLCLECHLGTDIAGNPRHQFNGAGPEEQVCTRCHLPHVSTSRFFLKTGEKGEGGRENGPG